MVVYRDNGDGDVATTFMSMMYEEYERLSDLLHANVPMNPLNDDQLADFNTSTTCYLCEDPLTSDDKVKDHCHYTLVH